MADNLPSREEILQFIADQTGKVTKREVARAFGITGEARIGLKRLMREMAAEGLLDDRKEKSPKRLPSVGVIRITGRDADGDFIARPVHRGVVQDAPSIRIIEGGGRRRSPLAEGDTLLARLAHVKAGRYEGRIIRKIGSEGGRLIGIIRQNGTTWITPVERRERDEYQATPDSPKAEAGDLVVAEKVSGSGVKAARIVENLGSSHAPCAFSTIALAEQGITEAFPEAVISEAGRAKPATPEGREDLRSIGFVTIDPEDARDHDDAVYAEADNQGGHIVWVAIADVAAYVRGGSPMDAEAARRGNSVYLPDRVVPMLPEVISNDLCSLREKEERPCLAVRMVFDAEGNRRSHTFHRGLMRSAARLTYRQAQAAFDGKGDDKNLRALWNAYQAMAKARDARAPLALEMAERRIELDDTGAIARIYTPPRLEAHKLIEEMMIAANVCAAETLEKHKMPLVYRIHDAPDMERVRALADFVRPLGGSIDLGQPVSPRMFNQMLNKQRDGAHYPALCKAVLYAQSQAVYATGNIGHFGLNLGRYAHFTSPIRRYSDLLVHRALIRALELGDDGLEDRQIGALPEIAEAVSLSERRAMLAERSATDRYVAAFMAGQVGDSFTARVSGVSRAGLFVELDETGASGLIPISRLGHERFYADDDKLTLSGDTTGLTFRIGEEVQVQLEEAAPFKGQLLFSLLDGGHIARRVRGARRGKRNFRPRKRR